MKKVKKITPIKNEKTLCKKCKFGYARHCKKTHCGSCEMSEGRYCKCVKINEGAPCPYFERYKEEAQQ